MIRKTQDPKSPNAMTPRQHVAGGLLGIGDGLIRVFSLGHLATGWNLQWAIRCTKRNWP